MASTVTQIDNVTVETDGDSLVHQVSGLASGATVIEVHEMTANPDAPGTPIVLVRIDKVEEESEPSG